MKKSEDKKWSQNDVDILIDMYPNYNCGQIAEKLERTTIAVSSKAYYLKLKKPDNWNDNPNAKRFTKGHLTNKEKPPHNKGKKITEWLSADKIEKLKETQFKKGHKPKHTEPVGTIALRGQSKDAKPYQWIKVSENEWIPLHHKIWIKANGDIPDDHIIIFKDGDRYNVNIDNLQMISKTEHIERNRDSKYPIELRELIRIKNQLIKKIWQRTK